MKTRLMLLSLIAALLLALAPVGAVSAQGTPPTPQPVAVTVWSEDAPAVKFCREKLGPGGTMNATTQLSYPPLTKLYGQISAIVCEKFDEGGRSIGYQEYDGAEFRDWLTKQMSAWNRQLVPVLVGMLIGWATSPSGVSVPVTP